VSDVDELKRELARWKCIAAYLASCHAANLHIAQLTRTSRHERERLRVIMTRAADMLEGKELPKQYASNVCQAQAKVNDAIDRLRDHAERVP